MSFSMTALESFLKLDTVLVEIIGAAGSTPRDCGAWMLVAKADVKGTIGGGQLEFIAIDTARQMLRGGDKTRTLDVPLGPEIGQCCGGRVELKLARVDMELAAVLRARFSREVGAHAHVYVMGAGHVGRALVRALALLPLKTVIVDNRAQTLDGLPKNIETRLRAIPEAEVRLAPAGSAFVVLTHDHALDFLIAREALEREDACYVGMIGSRTKRAAFASWLKVETGSKALAEHLTCPIGGHNLSDKRPEIIAALVVHEILVQSGRPERGVGMIKDDADVLGARN